MSVEYQPGEGNKQLRILFTTLPLSGHFLPLVPFARALVQAGHEVAFATCPTFGPSLTSAGFRHVPVGSDQVNFFLGREAFINLWPRDATADILTLAETWRPDLVVRGALDYAGCLAAEVFGCPHAAVSVNAGGDLFRREHLSEPLAAYRARTACRRIPSWPCSTAI